MIIKGTSTASTYAPSAAGYTLPLILPCCWSCFADLPFFKGEDYCEAVFVLLCFILSIISFVCSFIFIFNMICEFVYICYFSGFIINILGEIAPHSTFPPHSLCCLALSMSV